MERIIYMSKSRTPPDSALVADILGASRRNNGRDELTGLLFVGGDHFLQVIEGPSDLLDAAYRRIGADPRHHDLKLLSRTRVDERAFGDWDMGCEHLDGDDLADLVEDLTGTAPSDDLRGQFYAFVGDDRPT